MAIGFAFIMMAFVVWWAKRGRSAGRAQPAPGPRSAAQQRERRQVAEPAPSGARGVYLLDEDLVGELAGAGAVLSQLQPGIYAVHWSRPGVILGRGTEEVEEILTAPDGTVWRASPVAGDAPWWLERAAGWEPREAP